MRTRPPKRKRPGNHAAAFRPELLRKLTQYARLFIAPVWVALFLAAICAGCTLAAPRLISQMAKLITDSFRSTMDWEGIRRLALLLVLTCCLSTFCSVTQHLLMTKFTYRFSKKLRSDISRKIDRLPLSYFHETSLGEVLSRITNDVDAVSQSLNQSVGMLVQALTLLLGSVLMMSLTNLTLMVTAVVSALIGFTLMKGIMDRSQRYFFGQQSQLGRINGYIEEVYTGHTTVKVNGAEDSVNAAFAAMNEDLRDSSFKAQCLAGLMQPLMGLIGNLGYVAVCLVGAVMVLRGRIGFEVIVAFIMYIHYFTQPLSQLAQAAQSFQAAFAACDRIFPFLEEGEMEEESFKPAAPGVVRGEVTFENVSFRYHQEGACVINDLSFTAKPGQKIAIVGPTGAGKTTLVNLLMRFYEPSQGRILLDGQPISEINQESLREKIAMVLQEDWLFEGTVRANLTLGREDIPEETLERVCCGLHIDGLIRSLPKGYDTVLDNQVSLSQGQKQMLTIARAMIADRPIVILDEATGSLDVKTEFDLQNAMDRLMKNRTVFVIAHRLSTIENADRILVIQRGRLVETGTHRQLMEKAGIYRTLHDSQFRS